MIPDYKERSAVTFGVGLYGIDDRPALPNSTEYRLDCLTTGQEVIGWTSCSPTLVVDALGEPVSCEVEIEIPASAHALRSTRSNAETKALLVVADRNTDQEYSGEFQYRIVNLRGR